MDALLLEKRVVDSMARSQAERTSWNFPQRGEKDRLTSLPGVMA